jgi:hypothetical protein
VFREDLPSIRASRLQALGEITAESASIVIRLGDSEFSVGLALHKFPNGGWWSLFRCPQCERRAQVLWLFEGRPVCQRCGTARGVGRRAWPMSQRQRAEISVLKLQARLESKTPARLHPRPDGSMLDRRQRLENSLRLARLALRRHRFKGALRDLQKQGD